MVISLMLVCSLFMFVQSTNQPTNLSNVEVCTTRPADLSFVRSERKTNDHNMLLYMNTERNILLSMNISPVKENQEHQIQNYRNQYQSTSPVFCQVQSP